MLRSLFSAISGLRANQTMLDVTGNNIANANTAGFKSSNIIFQDTLSQMLTAAGAPSDDPAAPGGGTNPMQVGLGVQVGGITTSFNQGSQQTTGKPTHLMIQGDGFFMVQRNGEELYTRLGAFNFDGDGNLVTLDGDLVMGYDSADGGDALSTTQGPIKINEIADDTLTPKLLSYNIGADGSITGVFEGDSTPKVLAQIRIANFSNPEGLEKVGDTMFRATTNSGVTQYGDPGTGRIGKLVSGALEMSNVDLAQEFTNLIIAQRGFQATSRVITTSDQVLEELVNIKR
jgi:flagellar hook protein FlgE